MSRTLQDAAESWARARHLPVPPRGTPAWHGMFMAWQRGGMSPNPLYTAALRPTMSVRQTPEATLALAHELARANRGAVFSGAPVAVFETMPRLRKFTGQLGSATGSGDVAEFPRLANKSDGGLERFSEIGGTSEASFGDLVSERTRPVLQVLSQGFGGGRAFTRDELAHEAVSIRGAQGQHLSPGSIGVRVGHALSELEKRGYVERIGKELNQQGRPGPMRFTLTKTGEERAMAGQEAADFAFGENVVEAQIARLESAAPPPARAPLSGAVYRPTLRIQETRGHKLPPLQAGRVRAAGYRTCNPLDWRLVEQLDREGIPAEGRIASDRVLRGGHVLRGIFYAVARKGGETVMLSAHVADVKDFRFTPKGRDPNPTGSPLSGPIRQSASGLEFITYRPGGSARPRLKIHPEDEAVLAQGEADELRALLSRRGNPDEDIQELERLALASGDSSIWTRLWAEQKRRGLRRKLTTKEAYRRLEAAGIPVWRGDDRKHIRVYEPGREGAYLVLEPGFQDERWSDFPQPKPGKESTRLSGGFKNLVYRAIESVRAVNPQDEDLRALERAASLGDPAALLRLERARARSSRRPPKGAPTHTNLSAFWDHMKGRDEAPSRVEAGSAPHLKRILAAGYLVPSADRQSVILTPLGRTVLDAFHADQLRLIPPDNLARYSPWAVPPRANAPRSKKCLMGFHDFESATGLCRRSGCQAFHHAGQASMFGRDLDPTAVREALERERLTGQRDFFARPNPLTGIEASKVLDRAARELMSLRPSTSQASRLESAATAYEDAAIVQQFGPRLMHGNAARLQADAGRVLYSAQDHFRGVKAIPLGSIPTPNPITDARDPGGPLLFATVTGKKDRQLAGHFGTDIGRGRFAFTREAWAALMLARRMPNPLSVLLLGNSPPGAGSGRRPRAARAPNSPRERGAIPPAGTLGLEAVRKHHLMFHGAPVATWKTVDIEDGRPGITHEAATALGVTEATVYSAPWRKSNKHKGGVYEHVHETHKPIEAYRPASHTTIKVLPDGAGPSDWWRDDEDPRDSLPRTRSRRRTA